MLEFGGTDFVAHPVHDFPAFEYLVVILGLQSLLAKVRYGRLRVTHVD